MEFIISIGILIYLIVSLVTIYLIGKLPDMDKLDAD